MTLSADIAAHLRARPDGVFLSGPSHAIHPNPATALAHIGVRQAASPATHPGTRQEEASAKPVPASAHASSAAAETAPVSARGIAGNVAAGYIICEEIGRGGIGQVNRAVQRVFGRMVAIKQLSAGQISDKAAATFFAEALIAASLEHPNIVPIHDLIVSADGRLQLVMKRVEGLSWGNLLEPHTLNERGRAAGMSLDDHLDILMKVCDAVAFAHGRGILHNDLKPDNVMVGSFGEVLVMDWGCALALSDGVHHPLIPCVATVKSPLGTPSYMAPESALATSDRIGPHSDVYQLGAVLYELLTGQQPNRGVEVDDVMRDAAYGTLVPPQQAAPGRAIPDELADICMQCLQKDTASRIPSVNVLIIRLTAYRRHAQAVTLAATARRLLIEARQADQDRDDLLRRALSSAEQAFAIWPEWRGAGLALVNAQLALAQHQLGTGATTAARLCGTRAGILANDLGLTRQATTADRIADAALTAERAQEAHRRRYHLIRMALVTALSVLVIGLVASVIIVTSAERRMASALASTDAARLQAETALSSLTAVQQHRAEDQRRFAPAIVDQARKEMQGKQWDQAAHALETAILFDAQLIDARALYANVLVAGGHYATAAAAISHWLELAPGDPSALQLRDLCARAHQGAELDLELKTALATLFSDQRLYTLAEGLAVALPDRLELYRKRIEAVWPGIGSGLNIRPDGLLTTTIDHHIAFAGHSEIVDLTALQGMPFAVLNLSGTQVHDLSPLRGMPLEALNLEHTPVIDLGALTGMHLTTLLLGSTQVRGLDELHGMKLSRLSVNDTMITSVASLAGMSFQRLDISRTRVESLAPLSGVAQGDVIARQTRVHALSPLIGTPVQSLDVTGCHLDDLTVLARLQVRQVSGLTIRPAALKRIVTVPVTGLDLGECPELTDLEAVRGMRLTSLSVTGSQLTDLAPLIGMPLRSLTLRANHIASLDALKGMRLEYLDVSHNPIAELEPLRGMPLKTVCIDHTQIRTVSVLSSMPLEELQWGPLRGEVITGLDAVRHLSSIRSIGTASDQMMPPAPFWHSFDAGDIP